MLEHMNKWQQLYKFSDMNYQISVVVCEITRHLKHVDC